MVTLSYAQYRDKVYGGLLGKLIGSAVGAPFDGQKQPADVQGAPEALLRHQGRPVEGLDFAVVWLRALQTSGPSLGADELIGAWLRHLRYSAGEYAHAQASFTREVPPPVSGVFDNPFRESLGALARAEIWGLVAPGDPEVAARYARQDAMLDHSGAGVDAAIMLAAIVSAAFVTADPARLLDIGLTFVPEDGRAARAVRDVVRWHSELAHWRRTREMLLRAYAAEDVRDSTIAIGLISLALLHGAGDFSRTLMTAAGSGWSTACTCGAAAAIHGAAHGAERIPETWRAPFRGEISLGWGVVGQPRTLRAAILAEDICDVGRLVTRAQSPGRVQITEEPTDEPSELADPRAADFVRQLQVGPYVAAYRRGQVEIHIDYDGPPTVGYNVPRRLAISITNAGSRAADIRTRLSAPAGFVVTSPSEHVSLPEGGSVSFRAAISAPQEHAQVASVNPCTLYISIEDEAEATVPIALVGEALWHAAGPYGSFDEQHAPEQPGILAGDAPLGGEGWRSLSVPEPSVNVLADFEGDQGTYYLATDVWMPRSRRARLRIGCNDGVKAWLNAEEVLYQHEHRPVSPLSADEVEIDLREGWNRLVIKMAQCSARRFLSVGLRDLDRHLLAEAVNTFPRRH